MDFESIYKLCEADAQTPSPAPVATTENDGLSPEIHASEETLNIAMNQLSLIVKNFKDDNYIHTMMDFYDGKAPKNESLEASNTKEHLTEAKKGSFKSYYNQLVKSTTNVTKKLKIAGLIFIAVAVAAGIGGTVLFSKLKKGKLDLKNIDGNAIKNPGMIPNATNIPAGTVANIQSDIVNKPVEDTKPMSNLGGMTTHDWVVSKKNAGLNQEQISTEYEKEGYSRNGPKFIAAMTAVFGGVTLASVTKSPTTPTFTGTTDDGKNVVGDTTTYAVKAVSEEQKEAQDAQIQQEISENPAEAEKAAEDVKAEETDTPEATGTENASVEGENAEQKDGETSDENKEKIGAIDFSNAQAAWQKGLENGGQIRNVRGVGNGWVMFIPNEQKLVWSDKKNNGTQFETYDTSDDGQSFIKGDKRFVFDGKKYSIDKQAAVISENGQPLSLQQFIMREAKKHAQEDQYVRGYVQKRNRGVYVCGQYSWGGMVAVPGNNPKDEHDTRYHLGSKIYVNGQMSNYYFMAVGNGLSTKEIIATDGQIIMFLKHNTQQGTIVEGMPIGTPLSMAQVVQNLVKLSENTGVSTVSLATATGYGALVGTAICPGLGTVLGTFIGFLAGALAAGTAADVKRKGIFGVIAWNTLDEQSKQLLVQHSAKYFSFNQNDVAGLGEAELSQKVNKAKQVYQTYGLNIAAAGQPKPTDSINAVLRNVGNAIACEELGYSNTSNPYQVEASKYIQELA